MVDKLRMLLKIVAYLKLFLIYILYRNVSEFLTKE